MTAHGHGLAVVFRQSNHEGDIIDWIHEARVDNALGLVINPAGFTTTSVAILDALLTLDAPIIEVHITNIHAREEFRRYSYVSKVARAVICGFGTEGYALAITGLAAVTGAKE
jgi:3-dehydroquinate dehydratase-2